MIPLSNDKIEEIRKISQQKIRDRYGGHVNLYVQNYKAGEYIRYVVEGVAINDLSECRKIITHSGSVIGKVYLDEGYSNKEE